MFGRRPSVRQGQWLMVVALGAAGLVYHAAGYYWLLVAESGAWDLRLRWLEQRIVLAGANPYDVAIAVSEGREIAPALRPYTTGLMVGYPPWSYFAGAVMFGPPWPWTRVLYAVLNLVATVVILAEVYRRTRIAGVWAAALMAGSCWAMAANYSTLIAGNYGILVTAAVMASLRLLESRRGWTAGMLLGVALAKPTLSAPFLVPCLLKRRWTALAGCVLYVVVSCAVVWWWTGTSTLTMLRQMVTAGETYASEAYGPPNLLMALGVRPRTALLATGLVGFLVVVGIAWRQRAAPLMFHFAVAATVARLATYHKVHDNVILVFLLLAVGAMATRQTSRSAWMVLLALGATLWLPGRLVAYPERYPVTIWVQLAHVLVWCITVGYVVRRRPHQPIEGSVSWGGAR